MLADHTIYLFNIWFAIPLDSVQNAIIPYQRFLEGYIYPAIV